MFRRQQIGSYNSPCVHSVFVLYSLLAVLPTATLAGFSIPKPKVSTPRFGGTSPVDIAKDLDPFNKNSGVREKMRFLDPSARSHKEIERTGKHFGKGFGKGLKPSLDAVVDHASDKLTENIDHAAEKLGEELKTFKADVDKAAEDRINQFLKGVGQQWELTSTDVDTKIEKVIVESNRLMDQHAQIMDDTTTRIEHLTDRTTTRIENLADRTTGRLERLQASSLDRIEGFVEDQVPVASGEVAQEAEMLALVAIFFIVLVGVSGYKMVSGVQKEFEESEKTRKLNTGNFFQKGWSFVMTDTGVAWTGLKKNMNVVPQILLRVGVPMFVLSLVIHLSYKAYCGFQFDRRVARIASIAHDFESRGDFISSLAYRRRAVALKVTDENRYYLLRTQWLADYVQRLRPRDVDELTRRLVSIRSDRRFAEYADDDKELKAVQLYLLSGDLADNDVLTALLLSVNNSFNGSTDLRQQIDAFVQDVHDHLEKEDFDEIPYFGRLVIMAKLRMCLNESIKSVSDRMEEADNIADTVVDAYPDYAPGLLLSSYIRSLRFDAAEKAPTKYANAAFNLADNPRNVADDIKKEKEAIILANLGEARGRFDAALAFDRSLAIMFSLTASDADSTLARQIYHCSDKYKNWRSEITAAFPDWVLPEALELSPEGTAALETLADEWIDEIKRLAQEVYVNDILAQAQAERVSRMAMRRAIGEMHVDHLIELARVKLNDGQVTAVDKHKMCSRIITEALSINRPDVAEAWLKRADNLAAENPETEFDNLGELGGKIREDLVPRLVFLP